MTSGIYKVTNAANGKYYIGSSSDIEARWEDHLFHLRRGTHTNPHLQDDWRRLGGASFFLSVVRIVRKDKAALIKAELRALSQLYPFDPDVVYNIKLISGSSLGSKRTLAQRAAMSLAAQPQAERQRGMSFGKKWRPGEMSKEHRAKIGRASRRRWADHNYREEVSARISAGLKGHQVSNETRAKMAAAKRGRKLSDDTRAKMREAQRQRRAREGW